MDIADKLVQLTQHPNRLFAFFYSYLEDIPSAVTQTGEIGIEILSALFRNIVVPVGGFGILGYLGKKILQRPPAPPANNMPNVHSSSTSDSSSSSSSEEDLPRQQGVLLVQQGIPLAQQGVPPRRIHG